METVEAAANLIPYQAEWTDSLGYPSGALGWIQQNIPVGDTREGIRFNSAGHVELITYKHNTAIKTGGVVQHFPTIELITYSKQLVSISLSCIDVYRNTSKDRNDIRAHYRRFIGPKGPEWMLVTERIERTIENLDYCPQMLNWYFPQCARLIHKSWRKFIYPKDGAEGEESRLPFDIAALTHGRRNLLPFQSDEVSQRLQQLYTDLSLLTKSFVGKRLISSELQVPPSHYEQVEFLRRLLLLCWAISQNLPPEHSISKEEWILALIKQEALVDKFPDVIALVRGALLVD